MKWLRNISIRGKLIIVCLTTSMFALLIAAVAFYTYELRTFRVRLAEEYVTLANAIEPSTATALTFGDEDHANEILLELTNNEDFEAACIYDAEGVVFAWASREDSDSHFVPPPAENRGYWFIGDELSLFEPIVLEEEFLGTVFLNVRLPSAKARAYNYAQLVAGILLVSLLAAFILSTILVRFISRPLLELAETTRLVAEQKNYSLRAEKTTDDELGDLIDNFNEMLEQIQQRDIKLAEHRDQLEVEVAERTHEIQKLSLAVEQSPTTIVITDIDGNVEYVNHEFVEMTGYTLEQALDRDPIIVTTGMMEGEQLLELERTLQSGGEWLGEFQNRKRDGHIFWESARIAPLRDGKDKITHHVWVKEDITERKRSDEALRESEDRYALAAHGSNDGLWDWDIRNNSVYYSTRWKGMLGYPENEIGSDPDEWFTRIHKDDIGEVRHKIDLHLQGKTPLFKHEFRMLHRDGTFRWVLSRGVSVHSDEGQAYRFAGSQTDITDRKLAEEKLFYEASHDELTGLPNRGLFLERLRGAMRRSKRSGEIRFAVLFLDLDRFKNVNDSLGHVAGDELLVQAGKRIAVCVRNMDVIARLGGDEFAILLEDIENDEDAMRTAERIQVELSRPFYLDDHEVYSTASIGIALSTHGYQQAEDMLRDSDTAMYRAKSLGKARFAIFDTHLHDQAINRLQIENDLRRALENEEFLLYYQPIVSVETKKTVGFEALARWMHPERGLVSPVEFIPVAEETGLIVPMGWWILREACKEAKRWHDEYDSHEDLTVSVNISGKQFLQGDFIDRLKEILNETGLKGSSIKLEITETVIIENPDVVSKTLEDVKELETELCIDDFGTGYSSFSYLHSFPFDVVKIDRSFVGMIDREPEALEIVNAIISLSESLGLSVVAEGVETTEQLLLLESMNCEHAQGFLFAKPMPADEVPEYLGAALKTLEASDVGSE